VDRRERAAVLRGVWCGALEGPRLEAEGVSSPPQSTLDAMPYLGVGCHTCEPYTARTPSVAMMTNPAQSGWTGLGGGGAATVQVIAWTSWREAESASGAMLGNAITDQIVAVRGETERLREPVCRNACTCAVSAPRARTVRGCRIPANSRSTLLWDARLRDGSIS